MVLVHEICFKKYFREEVRSRPRIGIHSASSKDEKLKLVVPKTNLQTAKLFFSIYSEGIPKTLRNTVEVDQLHCIASVSSSFLYICRGMKM